MEDQTVHALPSLSLAIYEQRPLPGLRNNQDARFNGRLRKVFLRNNQDFLFGQRKEKRKAGQCARPSACDVWLC